MPATRHRSSAVNGWEGRAEQPGLRPETVWVCVSANADCSARLVCSEADGPASLEAD
jgi:hypothetical protein